MAVSVNLAKGLDKDYEDKSLKEVLDAPVSALSGITDAKGELLAKDLGIKTVRDLGNNKYFALAAALVTLEQKEG